MQKTKTKNDKLIQKTKKQKQQPYKKALTIQKYQQKTEENKQYQQKQET